MKTIIFFLLIINCFQLFSQPQSMTVFFKARYFLGDDVPLDSILIINRNRNCDTTLYAPDTTLVLYYTLGLNRNYSTIGNFYLSDFAPNPITNGSTVLTLSIPSDGYALIKLFDISGNILIKNNYYFKAGTYKLKLKVPQKGIYLLTAFYNGAFKTKKIISTGTLGYSHYEIFINKFNTINKKIKNILIRRNYWWFEPGDTLWYIGYALTPDYISGSDIIEGIPEVTTNFVNFHIVEGVPCTGIEGVKYYGKLYPTVEIDGRCWFKENLNVGIMINSDTNMTDNGIIEKYCYDNDTNNCNEYGGLYQWDELMQYTTENMTQGICPNGWHIPSIDEFNEMTQGYWGNDFKEVGNIHWELGSHGTNIKGFTALPSGGWDKYNNVFRMIRTDAPFFTSTKLDPPYWGAYFKDFNLTGGMSYGNTHLPDGLSVRCIKDE